MWNELTFQQICECSIEYGDEQTDCRRVDTKVCMCVCQALLIEADKQATLK